jgi:hypothetical protein
MSRSLLAALVIAAIAMPADAGRKAKNGKRKGKVVRVERSRLDGAGMVRMCISVQQDGSATCYGKAPRVGEMATVFDETGRRATLAITAVTPQLDSCGNEVNWFMTSNVQGDLSQMSYMAVALIDWEGETRTHAVPAQQIPGLRPGENVWTGFDDDGDQVADLLITSYSCDASGTSQQYGAGAMGYCMSYYKGEGSSYTMLRTDIVPSC